LIELTRGNYTYLEEKGKKCGACSLTQSEHLWSPHHNDQAKLHSQRKAKRFRFTPSDNLEHAESVRGKEIG